MLIDCCWIHRAKDRGIVQDCETKFSMLGPPKITCQCLFIFHMIFPTIPSKV